MAASAQKPDLRIQVRRTFKAPRERVFRAWIEQADLEEWMCRDVPTHRVRYLELNVKKGGRYVMEVSDSSTGDMYVGRGAFLVVTVPEKLVFSWAWQKRQPDGSLAQLESETQVTVEFWERGASTEVLLTHERFPAEKAAKETETGWKGCFDALELVLE